MGLALPGATNIGLFVAAALTLLIIPGPAVLYIISRSVAQGRVAGLVSNLGIHAATLVHVAAASLGLSALLMSSALAFSLVKYLGAAYLVWLGLRKLLGPNAAHGDMAAAPRRSRYRLFRDGFIVNLLNPKTALFFFAFLPQFVDPHQGHVALQVAFLGGLFTCLGMVTDGCYALAAGTAGHWMKRSHGFARVERYLTGTVLVGLGLTTALAGQARK
jgi:threonine/homoserine/homoserine lactone efflux protein